MQWNLIKLRKEHDLQQSDMADILDIHSDSYGKKERGKVQFTLDEMFALSDHFNKPMDEIFLKRNFGKNEAKKQSK